MYDPKTTETLSGAVVKIDRITPMRGMPRGVRVIVKGSTGEVSVHLGPHRYLENQDVRLEPGDKLEIAGSRATVQGRPELIAAEVKNGDQVLMLRDAAGVPLWSGRRR